MAEKVPLTAVFDFGPSLDFRCILLTVGGQTYEITPAIARKLACGLNECADDVEKTLLASPEPVRC